MRWIALICAAFWLVLMLFVLYDMPTKPPEPSAVYVFVNEPLPYPEEDTMHYITEKGEIIIYEGKADD